jgi:hypothetical protein
VSISSTAAIRFTHLNLATVGYDLARSLPFQQNILRLFEFVNWRLVAQGLAVVGTDILWLRTIVKLNIISKGGSYTRCEQYPHNDDVSTYISSHPPTP